VNTVIIGAGLAGANAAEELRDQGHTGDIVLVGAESHRPYERPPLSKGILLGTDEPDSAYVHDTAWYADHQIELITNTPVTGVDLDRRRIALAERELAYDRLLIATGSTPRHLPFIDRSRAEVVYLRTLDDSLALRQRLAGTILIVGAGWIGLEAAAAARQAGADVTVVESAPQPLAGLLGPQLSRLFTDRHRDNGVDLRVGTSVESIERQDSTTTALLSDGHELQPDLILVGIGAQPDDELASKAGLETGNGVLVDGALRAGDEHVYAAGDVANHDHPLLGRIRVEHWNNAINQGRHAARSMLGGDAPYVGQPYFFTDQYDLGMEYVGHVGGDDGYDELIMRGDIDDGAISALWVRADTVVAGMHVNDWDAIEPLRACIGHPATSALRDRTIPLAEAT